MHRKLNMIPAKKVSGIKVSYSNIRTSRPPHAAPNNGRILHEIAFSDSQIKSWQPQIYLNQTAAFCSSFSYVEARRTRTARTQIDEHLPFLLIYLIDFRSNWNDKGCGRTKANAKGAKEKCNFCYSIMLEMGMTLGLFRIRDRRKDATEYRRST